MTTRSFASCRGSSAASSSTSARSSRPTRGATSPRAFALDEARVRALDPDVDLKTVRTALAAIARGVRRRRSGRPDRPAVAARALPLAGRAAQHHHPDLGRSHRPLRRPRRCARAPARAHGAAAFPALDPAMNDLAPAAGAPAGDLPFRPIAELVREHARGAPRQPALVDATATIDYGALDALMDRIAAALQRDGVAPGDAIAICAVNSARYAARLSRRVARRRGRRAARRVGDAGELSLDARRCRRAPALRRRQRRRGARRRRRPAAAHLARRPLRGRRVRGLARVRTGGSRAPVEIRPEMAFNIIYSSGTTGTPKGIVQPHGMRWTHVMRGGRFGYGRDTVTLLADAALLEHDAGRLLSDDRFRRHGRADGQVRRRPLPRARRARTASTHTMLVPVQYQRLMASPHFAEHDLSSFRMKFCTSAPFAAALKADVVARWPGGLVEFYGMTEGGGTCILAAHEHPTKLHTVGQPAEGHDIRLIDEAGLRAAARRDRRGRRPFGGDDGRLSRPAREDRRGRMVRQRRQALHPHRRRRPLRRRGLPHARRSAQGHDHQRRLQSLPERPRGGAAPARRRRRGGGRRRAVGALGRDAGGLGRACAKVQRSTPRRCAPGPTSASARPSASPSSPSSTSCRAARSARCSSASCAIASSPLLPLHPERRHG